MKLLVLGSWTPSLYEKQTGHLSAYLHTWKEALRCASSGLQANKWQSEMWEQQVLQIHFSNINSL